MTCTIAAMIMIGVTFLPVSATSAEAVDHSLFDKLLKNHVQKGFVNYQGFKNHEKKTKGCPY